MVLAVKTDMFTASPSKPAAGDHSGLARLAAQVPKVKMTSDQAENNKRNRIRSSMVNIIDWVCKNPEKCPDVWLSLSHGQVVSIASNCIDGGDEGTAIDATNPFDKPTFGKVSTDALAKWLCGLPDGPSKDLIDLVDSQDARAVRDIFTALLQLRPIDRIPAEARKDFKIAHKMLMSRMEVVGPRLPGWFRKSVNGKGDVDFSKVPLYAPEFENNRMKSIRHISGDLATIPDHVNITQDYCMQAPHDDMGAMMVKHPDEHLVANFFEAGKGPKRHALDRKNKSLDGLAEKAKKEVETETTAAKVKEPPVDLSGAVLQRRAKEKRAAALEKARQALESAPKRSRTIEFFV